MFTIHIVKNGSWAGHGSLLISSIMLLILWLKAWRNRDEHQVHQQLICTAKWKSLELNDIDGLYMHACRHINFRAFNWSGSVLY